MTFSAVHLPTNSPPPEDCLRGAPHFAELAALTDMAAKAREHPLRLLVLCGDSATAQQGVAYLAACGRQRETADDRDDEDGWLDLDDSLSELTEMLAKEDGDEGTEELLTVTEPSQLFPTDEEDAPAASAQRRGIAVEMRSHCRDVAYLLVEEAAGPVLGDSMVDFLVGCSARVLAVVLRPGQRQLPLMRRLYFEQGFRVCQVDAPGVAYQRRVFERLAGAHKVTLADDLRFDEVLRHLKQMRGARFSDEDFSRLLRYAAETYTGGGALTTEQLVFPALTGAETDALEKLDAMVGLAAVKAAVRGIIADAALSARRSLAGIPDLPRCRNLTFAGEPGTGKSVTARLLAQALQDAGAGSGAFVEAGREQLIGQFLGRTSPKIAELFQQARDGVLFIDEAGALLDGGNQDTYATEAVNALVRHMELNPGTVVIFATYSGEMDTLLGQNPGLSSRIARNLVFPAYTDTELLEITRHLADTARYRLPEGWEAVCRKFFSALRAQQGDRFGNGREARRLLNTAIENLALRVADGGEDLEQLTAQDLSAAAHTLLDGRQAKMSRVIGF